MGGTYLASDVQAFNATVTVRCRESKPACSQFHYHSHWRFRSICFTCEADGKILLLLHPFFYFFLSNNSFLLQAMVLGCTCRVMIIKKGRSSSSITEFNILWYVDFQHFLIKLLFLWIFWLFCQDMYNTWLKERYKDDHLTHPDLDPNLWLEARLFDEPDRNWVYNLSHTTVRTYRRPIVFQPLDAQNRFGILQLWNSRWF